jgi:malate-CoA ligase subunit alpha
MGHAGAIVTSYGEAAEEKVAILREAGVTIAPTPADMGKTVAEVVSRLKQVA